MARVGVFLDRDGTIIFDRHYPADPDQVELLPGAAAAIARLNETGLPVFVVTNQSGIGRGMYTEADFRAVQARMEALLAEAGALVQGTYHCPHAPDRQPPCDCRKPAAGLFERAAAEHDLDLARSAFVGDRLRDVLPAVRFGGRGVFLRGPGTSGEPSEAPAGVPEMSSLAEAVDWLLGPGGLIDPR
ncbi:MAG TPA: HAD family hydrolase [Longimicrobiaceae bacterium]|nr:HAD family hydrolase [Longimicrobiaceae bacterium]